MAYIRATPYAKKTARQYHIDLAAVTPTGSRGEVTGADVLRAREGRQRSREVPVTPLAARIARELNINLEHVKGTGIGGKISKRDVQSAAGRRHPELMPGELLQQMSSMRRSIASEMTEASKIPTVTVTTKVDVTAMNELRLRLNAEGTVHYSVNDFILIACAKALKKNKRLLSSCEGDSIIYKNDINIGMVVSLDDGVLTPVIREADCMTPEELSLKAHELARRARSKKLALEELQGSTFTVTNLGMYGVEAFTPVLHLPNAAVLGVCSIYEGCAVKDGAVEVRKLMHICTTFDHRVLDGADAAKFNLTVREYLENPEGLLN